VKGHVSGHDFSRAVTPPKIVIPSEARREPAAAGEQPALSEVEGERESRDLLFFFSKRVRAALAWVGYSLQLPRPSKSG
jgi:hypothetical protein